MFATGSDFEFSETVKGVRVDYGTSGDCYSALDCPQGMFSIDLSGTGFKISDSVTWQNQGSRSYKDIRIYKVKHEDLGQALCHVVRAVLS